MKLFPNARLIFTDTDSLYYYVETDDIEKVLFEHKEHLDYSDYPAGHPFKCDENKMVIGKFKCETKGAPIVEIVCLKPKMYSYTYKHDNPAQPIKEKIKIKGVSRAAAKELRHEMYLKQLNEAKENYLTNRRIGSVLHKIYTIKVLLVFHKSGEYYY